VKKAFLEIYTGFTCGNCPTASDLAEQLDSTYSGKMVIMEIHSGHYADPNAVHTYDFRTPVGNDLNTFFGADKIGNPNGTVNRVAFNGNVVMYKNNWEGAIQNVIAQKPIMTIAVTPYFNIKTNDIDVTVNITYLLDGSSSHYLSVYLVEDSIVQYQEDFRMTPIDIPNYVHNNVLRASFNGTWGDQLTTGTIRAGDVFKKEYHYTIPAGKDWRPDKLGVIAFVHDSGNSTEVFQVERNNNLILYF